MMPPNRLGRSKTSTTTMDNKNGGDVGDQATVTPLSTSTSTETNRQTPFSHPPIHLPNSYVSPQSHQLNPAAVVAYQQAMYCQLMSQSQVPVYDCNASTRPSPHLMPLSTFPPPFTPLFQNIPPEAASFQAAMNFAFWNNQHSLRQYITSPQTFNHSADSAYGRQPLPQRRNNNNNLIQLVDNEEGGNNLQQHKKSKSSPGELPKNGATANNQQWSLTPIPSTSNKQSSYQSSRSYRDDYDRNSRNLRSRERESRREPSPRRSSRRRSRSRSRSYSRSGSRSRSRSPARNRSRGYERSRNQQQRSSSTRGSDYRSSVRNEREKPVQPSTDTNLGSRFKLKSNLEELLTTPGTYTRCFPLEPYYRQASVVVGEKTTGDGANVLTTSVVAQGTDRLVALRQAFQREVLDRAEAVRAAKPAFSYPKRRVKLRRSNKLHDKCNGCDSETESDSESERFKDGGFAFNELQKKKTHPWRLHEELWHNDKGEMNDGPVCRCSLKARRSGIRHGIYLGEEPLPRCHPDTNNRHRLHHYLLTIKPLTNFVTNSPPTTIEYDGHRYLFEGYSLLSHAPIIDTVPPCRVIRFNIEYTVAFVETPPEDFPANFTIGDLDVFSRYLFDELLELVDFDMRAAGDEKGCTRFHFLPRFTRLLADGGKELLSMAAVLDYLRKSSRPLIEESALDDIERMSDLQWNEFTKAHKGSLLTCPGVKPSTLRVDQIDRERGDLGENNVTTNKTTSSTSSSSFSSDSNSCHSTSEKNEDEGEAMETKPSENPDQKTLDHRYPVLVHFGIRPPQLSYAGNPKYQRAWRDYVKYRHLLANKDRVSYMDKFLLTEKEAKLAEFRTKSDLKRDVTVVVSSRGFLTTGLQTDIVQHSLLMPVLVCHLRFHLSLQHLESLVGYRFKERSVLQLALTHPSYRENYGTNPDHARNTLTNCGLRALEYGDRRVHFANTRKRGINMLLAIMSRFGCPEETASHINHNERLEFLGDAVVEYLTSIHLYYLFPELEEGGLATYRAAIVQNQHLALLARKLQLERFMLYAHGSDLCHDLELRHAMANCFEAFMGALFLDGGIEVADGVFSRTLFLPPSPTSGPGPRFHSNHSNSNSNSCCGSNANFDQSSSNCEKDEEAEVGRTLYDIWTQLPRHPLQQQYPDGDRHLIPSIPRLQELARFEEVIGVQFRHIRLLARAFTHRSVGFNNLTLGSNQRMEFLGDTVLQLVTSEFLYKFFPDHHEGHLSLLRSSLVNNKTQSLVCDDLGITPVTHYNCVKLELKAKDRADLLEAFIGALYVDAGIEHCRRFCEVCFFPRLEEFISNQGWNDPKSKLQQCCLTLRSANGGEPDIPVYKVIESKGPTNTRIYVVAVYFRDRRLAVGKGHSIQEAEMNAATNALNSSKELFPHLVQQKKALERRNNNSGNSNNGLGNNSTSSSIVNSSSSSSSSKELGE